MERNFLEHSLPRKESSTGAKVPMSECSTERKLHASESYLCGLFRSRKRKCRGTKRPEITNSMVARLV